MWANMEDFEKKYMSEVKMLRFRGTSYFLMHNVISS